MTLPPLSRSKSRRILFIPIYYNEKAAKPQGKVSGGRRWQIFAEIVELHLFRKNTLTIL